MASGSGQARPDHPSTKQGERTRRKVLRYLVHYQAAHGYAPSIRQIMAGCGISSESVVVKHLKRLTQDGVIRRSPGIDRAIVVLKPEALGIDDDRLYHVVDSVHGTVYRHLTPVEADELINQR
jgi:SOS-response transcriptional repressor LexA